MQKRRRPLRQSVTLKFGAVDETFIRYSVSRSRTTRGQSFQDRVREMVRCFAETDETLDGPDFLRFVEQELAPMEPDESRREELLEQAQLLAIETGWGRRRKAG